MLNMKWYMYYKPLCYQLFPITNNSKNWVMSDLLLLIFSILKLDKQAEPGTSMCYKYSNMICFILGLILIFIIYIIYKSLSSIKYKSLFKSIQKSFYRFKR